MSRLRLAQRPSSAGGSSQEEYEESESESDRIMTSSNEGLQHSPLQQEQHHGMHGSMSSDNLGDAEEEDDDENATAINVARGSEPGFRPQPNAFNRPPTSNSDRPHVYRHQTQLYPSSSRPALRSANQRHSFAGDTVEHSPFNVISPSYQADQDAALRASLSTLLSCAAAARGLPKAGEVQSSNATQIRPAPAQMEPTGLRLVPESEVLGAATLEPAASPPRNALTQPSPRSRSADKSRRGSTWRTSSKERRASKKPRRPSSFGSQHPASYGYGFGAYSIDDISPTLLTWVVSAGVVVLVSALSFSAGYVVGKEAGLAEADTLTAMSNCGGEVVGRGTGLRRLRWADTLSLAV